MSVITRGYLPLNQLFTHYFIVTSSVIICLINVNSCSLTLVFHWPSTQRRLGCWQAPHGLRLILQSLTRPVTRQLLLPPGFLAYRGHKTNGWKMVGKPEETIGKPMENDGLMGFISGFMGV